jgi:cytochrome c-type protein NapC
VFGRFWKWFTEKPSRYGTGGLLLVGIVIGILFWGGFNWAMELTNNEAFCISCHEMKDNVYKEYTDSIHYLNRSGVRATCPDCHVPKEWIHKVVRKIQATNELFHHFAGTINTREKFLKKRGELAVDVWKVMKKTDSRECRNCHGETYMDFEKQEPRAAERHEEAFDKGLTCIDCHKGIAHELPEGWEELAKKNGLMPAAAKSGE